MGSFWWIPIVTILEVLNPHKDILICYRSSLYLVANARVMFFCVICLRSEFNCGNHIIDSKSFELFRVEDLLEIFLYKHLSETSLVFKRN
jgi:hypothetical protein